MMPWDKETLHQLHKIKDREQREWSLFMGYKVTMYEVVTLKKRLADMLRREGSKSGKR